MSLAKSQINCFNLEPSGLPMQAGWKYYRTIRKKAVEQEFSWSGLLISLSIAFFIVTVSAFALNFINHSIVAGQAGQKFKNIYYLESDIYLSSRHSGLTNNLAIYKFI